MINKKSIIIAAALAVFSTCLNPALADNNSLLQMDIKKSAAADTVDVTFFTTGDMSSSVASRKANNRYVVLLPNVSSTASVAPSFGAVKDLITDIDVKHVNDGIGGYTKVTFSTTKPINIKTHMKKTAPLTQAQKDYKEILAKNNTTTPTTQTSTKPQQSTKAVAQPKVAQTTTAKQQPKETAKPAAKHAQTKKVETIAKTLIAPIKAAPKPQQKVVDTVKPQPKKIVQPKSEPAKVQPKPVTAEETYVPKMKFDENGKRMVDLEPRVSHKIVEETQPKPKTDPIFDIDEKSVQQTPEATVENVPVAEETPQSENNSSNHHLPWWIFIAGGGIAVIGMLYLIFDAFMHSTKKDQTRLQSFFDIASQNQAKRRRREYYDIVNNGDLNWQEKYKLYSEKEEKRKIKKAPMDMSYVTDLSGVKKAIIEPETQSQETVKPVVQQLNITQGDDFKSKFNEKMQAKISQMEHALSQTPTVKEPEEINNNVKSEDDAIINKISEIKLKSFSKSITLKESQRTLADEDKISRNKSYKEGRFVKLKNSPLSVSRRKSTASGLSASDLIETGNKYLTNNGEIKMSKENENYLLSSLDEYLSILDSETEKKSTTAGSLAQLKSSAQPMTRSGMTNPISRAANSVQPGQNSTPYMNGLIVKSGYNIDSEKGFYIVNIDGVSALVGRIKDSIFVLKKFDHVVDKPIQVRPDDGSVYIVKVGKFKCLVDVAKDKMGTLIEI